MPRNLLDVYERHKDILYSSRTRKNTNAARDAQKLRQAVDRLLSTSCRPNSGTTPTSPTSETIARATA